MHITLITSKTARKSLFNSKFASHYQYLNHVNRLVGKSRLSTLALCFPGQGFQSPGMLRPFQAEYPAIVDPILHQVDKTLDLPLSKYLLDPSTDPSIVNLTSNAQPMLLTTSYALYKILENQAPTAKFAYMFGHSLGEYTAWTASGILSLDDAIWLVRKRGKAMESATIEYPEPTGMSAIAIPDGKYTDISDLIRNHILKNDQCLSIANINSTRQIVVSGSIVGIDRLVDSLTRDMGQRIISRQLAVSGPFHSKLMASAKEKLKTLLDEKSDRPVDIHWPPLDPDIQILSNITGKPFKSAEEISESILNTLTEPVNWLGCIEYLNSQPNIKSLVCIGPGRISRMSMKDTCLRMVYVDDVEVFKALELEV